MTIILITAWLLSGICMMLFNSQILKMDVTAGEVFLCLLCGPTVFLVVLIYLLSLTPIVIKGKK